MKNWSTKSHQAMLFEKKERNKIKKLEKELALKRQLPTTVVLDNFSNLNETAVYTNDGINFYNSRGEKI